MKVTPVKNKNMKRLKCFVKEITELRRIWLLLIFPLLYGIPILIANASCNHDSLAGLGYWGFFLSAPTSYLVMFITDSLPLGTDAYGHMRSFVAGTIQWGIILYIFSFWVTSSNKDKDDGFEELRKSNKHQV